MSQIFRNIKRTYFTSGAVFSNDFNPRDLHNLNAWFDGNQNINVISNKISTWFDSNGTENLLQQSQTFNSTWTQDGVSINADSTAAPDGTTTADTITEDNAAATFHRIYQLLSPNLDAGHVRTFSIYVKNISRRYISLLMFDGAGYSATFDLSGSGTVSYVDAGVITNIAPLDNGWFRISITATITAAQTYCQVFLNSTGGIWSGPGGVYNGDATSALYLWGAQLEQNARPGLYVATTNSTIVSNKVIQNTVGNRPTYNTNPLNSLPTTAFADANTTYLLNTSRPDLAPASITMTTVARYTTGQNISFIGGRGDTGSSGYWIAYLNTNVPTGNIGAGGGDARPTAGSENVNVWGVYTLIADDSSTTLFRNGATGTSVGTGDFIDYTGVTDFIVGQTTGLVAGRGLTGDISEITIYSTVLSTINHRRLERYLGRKYAITVV